MLQTPRHLLLKNISEKDVVEQTEVNDSYLCDYEYTKIVNEASETANYEIPLQSGDHNYTVNQNEEQENRPTENKDIGRKGSNTSFYFKFQLF